MPSNHKDFNQFWCVDFEYESGPGENPRPICMVAKELYSGHEVRMWRDDLGRCTSAPFGVGANSLFVCFYAPAEMGCFRALGWDAPAHVLDLFAEFRNLTNGRKTPSGNGLLGALAYFGLDSVGAVEKDGMRDLALRGGPWTEEEQDALLRYCASDVDAVLSLLAKMEPKLDLPRALFRGRYMIAVAAMEAVGVPIDGRTFEQLREYWPAIKAELIKEVDADIGVYEGTTFKTKLFEEWLVKKGIPWPRTKSGRLALDDDTFRQMSRQYSEVSPLRELRHAMSKLRLEGLQVGKDSRNRCMLSPYASKTGRNQPSTTKFAFGPAVWLRFLIKPPEGKAIAYVDWAQQEFGIAAALSGDRNMMDAYQSGDPYSRFAFQAELVSTHSTERERRQAREQSKQCLLGVQFSMGARTLALRLGVPERRAKELLRLHKSTYPTFWKWSDAVVDTAFLHNKVSTVYGWDLHNSPDSNPRTFRNFPMQANAAEMLRLACIFVTERGVRVCAPIHDALLIEAPVDEIEKAVATTQCAMAEASVAVLDGFELRSDASVYVHPARYRDQRGKVMWDRVMGILQKVKRVAS